MSDSELREHVLYLLKGGGAHLGFEQAFDSMPGHLRGSRVEGSSHTVWRLLEHLRICQSDILEFTRNAEHVSPEFPKGLWPPTDGPENDEQWERSLSQFRADLLAMTHLVANPDSNLLAKIPHGQGQTLLREALLLADHNAYHFGQVVFLRRCLGCWND